ncbi:concanavalin A-like lectin/glucanase superfamily protein [Fontibacillus phaseoli]|uniref:Concanavalin A-like lectin/glucanase superfamily protein n=1 Tax=Fontibacillus phaseoli TaxID=1416533 RepID=A0A369BCE3_9BACL|nr:LamG domain-containing protein [Fontibacillus phaseoli]RCX19015.1 concanavalin A-like lectin/glucanase superfamily protein [Fontibacillus phaseoli]
MEHEREAENKRSFVLGFIVTLLSLVVVYILCIFVKKEVTNSIYFEISGLFTVSVDSFLPEPQERLRFVLSVICFPVVISLVYLPINKVISKISSRITDTLFRIFVAISILILVSLLWIYGRQDSNHFFIRDYFLLNEPLISVLLIVLMAMTFFLFKYKKLNFELQTSHCRRINLFASILIISALLLISLTNVYSVYSINDTGMYTSHLNAVFHSVAAIYKGESLLVDVNNQYGLYPHFLEIIFRIIGLDVFKFTLVMSLLIFLCFYFLYKSLDHLITKKAFVILGIFFVIFYGYVHFKVYSRDPYFQYYPIRTLFPTLLIYCSIIFFKQQSKRKYYLFTLLFSMGVLWNLDTGLIVLIAWVLVLIYDSALQDQSFGSVIRKSSKHIITAIICLIVVVLFYCLFIYLRSGQIPDIVEFFSYQIYFYGYGFFMLPMELIHPWNLVALTYIVGLVISFIGFINKSRTTMMRLIFLLSILGTGLFSYYQGRSHNHVLSLVWYPALMLLILYIYLLYERQRNYFRNGEKQSWIFSFISIVSILFLVFTFITLLSSGKELYSVMNERWSKLVERNETPVTNELSFIKDNTSMDEKVLILSYHSGIDYLNSNADPFLNIPGTSELFLKKDYERIFAAIEDSSLNKVFIDNNFISNIQLNYGFNVKVLSLLYENFDIVDRSDLGNVLLLERKETSNSHLKMESLPEIKNSLHYYIYDNFYVGYPDTNEIIGIKENLSGINLDQQFTIEVVVKPENIQAPFAAIIGNHPGNGGQGFVIQQENKNQNKYNFSYGDGKGWNTTSSVQLDPDKWNYLTVTYDHGVVVIFKNGVLQNKIENDQLLFENSEMPLSIANWVNQDRAFRGEIREAVISNEILSQETIADRWKIIGGK